MAYLLAKDTVNGAEGTIVITRNGQNYVIAGMRNIRATGNIQSEDMRVVGTSAIQQKPNGVQLTGTGNIYYGFDLFREIVLQYINTGYMEEFDIQITNNDPTTSLGSDVTAYYGCHLTGEIPLSILDSETSMLNYDFNFAYTRVQKLQSFSAPETLGN
mgnify:FL=1